MHEANNGLIKVSGSESSVVPRHDGLARYDGTFTYGESIENAINAQHIETGTWDTAFISTTTNKDVAIFFATHDRDQQRCLGVVYTIDPTLFSQFGVVSGTSQNPKHPDESEVSIAPGSGEYIPREVVIAVEFVGF
ncbi:hypothetical protein DBY65_008595 [Pseudomonas sp. RIT412]|nr:MULTISPECIES: hypothetical protein [unclassified Pseudomonas]RAU54377.1 hypothetical protein DBY65_008595 [Pseudomonas sp. RIT 412]